MDDPEDMRQLVLGMASPRMFNKVFGDADPEMRGERLERWFNAKTATFGGEDAVDVVRGMFGNVSRFDFGEVADQIPQVDLPDLVPYFKALFAVGGKRPHQPDEIRLSFKTPRPWMNDFTIAEQYDLLFAREPRPDEGEDVAGVGLRVVDRALSVAVEYTQSLGALGGLEQPLVVFALRDRVTGAEGAVKKVVVGVQGTPEDGWTLLRDWEVIKLLNPLADKPRSRSFDATPKDGLAFPELLQGAESHLQAALTTLDLPFRLPAIESLACLIPGADT